MGVRDGTGGMRAGGRVGWGGGRLRACVHTCRTPFEDAGAERNWPRPPRSLLWHTRLPCACSDEGFWLHKTPRTGRSPAAKSIRAPELARASPYWRFRFQMERKRNPSFFNINSCFEERGGVYYTCRNAVLGKDLKKNHSSIL